MRGISGKVSIVTGGASGIGLATTQRLLEEGSHVLVVDSDAARIDAVATEAEIRSGSLHTLHIDVAAPEAAESIVRQCLAAFGEINFVVHCAAAFVMRGLEATRVEWETCLSVNVIAPALLTAAAAQHMNAGDAIVNVSSISAHIAQPGMTTYNTAKGAVSSLTRCQALELSARGIRVNAVNPGTVWTKNNETRQWAIHRRTRSDVEGDPANGGRHMLKRVADPDEIASSIVFLLSSEASFITAENLMVDGGYVAM